MPLWASWLRDFDILNLFYDEFKSEKMAKFETLIVPNGLKDTMLLLIGQVMSAAHLPTDIKDRGSEDLFIGPSRFFILFIK